MNFACLNVDRAFRAGRLRAARCLTLAQPHRPLFKLDNSVVTNGTTFWKSTLTFLQSCCRSTTSRATFSHMRIASMIEVIARRCTLEVYVHGGIE